MKFLYFSPYYPPQSEAAATRGYWFIKTLRDAGHKVDVLTLKDLKVKLASNKKVPLLRLAFENLAGIELFFRLFFSPKTDFVVLSSPPFFTIFWAALSCIIQRQRFILDARDLYPEVFFEMGLIKENSLAGRIAKKLTQVLYQKTFRIITVTQGLAQEIENYGISRDIIIVARNGFDPELFRPGKTEDKNDVFSLVFHGTLGMAQNIDTLIKIAKRLEAYSDIQIVVAGDGPKLNTVLNAKSANIRYVGNLNYSEIPELIKKCHVGISFRTDDKIGKEAFPVKVFEYVGCRLPVIVTPKCEAGTLLEEDGLGWQFHNSEIEAIVEKILYLKGLDQFDSNIPLEYSRVVQSQKILELFK